jgi:hypothetical protein
MSKSYTLALVALAVLGSTALVSTNASANVGRERLHAGAGGGERLHAAAGGGAERFHGPVHENNHGGCGPEGCVAHAGGSGGRLRFHTPRCEVRCGGEPGDHDHDHDHDRDHDRDHDNDDHGPIVWGGPHANWYVGWHRTHWVEPVGIAPSTTTVSTAVSTGAVASVPAASANCNCLTKQYLQDGSVLFKDICTKEAALATPDELKAQAQGTPMQAH